MSLNGILNNATSALQANTSQLNVVSQNISNVNTAGYVRRTAQTQTQVGATGVSGVEVSDIQRTVSKYLDQETYTSLGTSTQYNTESNLFDQVNAMLGEVGDGTSLASELSDITTSLGTASQSTSLDSSKADVVSSLSTFAKKVSSLYSQLTTLRSSASDQVQTDVSSVNALAAQISDLNVQIRNKTAAGDDATGLCDQRETAIQSLSKLVDVKTTALPDGSVKVTTNDGMLLVGDSYAVLSYSGGDTSSGYDDITVSYANPQTGKSTGVVDTFDQHIQSGELKGLVNMRDNTIGQLQTELGSLAQSTANAYNSVSNKYSSYPPANELTGRQTGLTDTEALNTSGTTVIGVADSSGKLVESYGFDFSGMSMDSIVNTINSNMTDAVASYDNGKLVIKANNDAQGVIIDSSANTGTTDFSTFFGLNDLFQTSSPCLPTTGLTGGNNAESNGQITLSLKNAQGAILQTGSVTVNTGDSITTVLNNLSTSLGGVVNFALNSDGSLSTTYANGYNDCTLTTTEDTTSRGTTGINLTSLLGIGSNTVSSYAAQFATKSTLNSSTLPLASVSIGAVNTLAVKSGDSSGAIALQKAETSQQSFAKAGSLAARTSSIGNYANAIYQDISTRSDSATNNYTVQKDRLTEAQKLQSSSEGVNLDEELSNMVVYQQAYSASARLLNTYSSLFDTLLNIAQ